MIWSGPYAAKALSLAGSWSRFARSPVATEWVPLTCTCGCQDWEHDQEDGRFGGCLNCVGCPRFRAAEEQREAA